MPQSDLKVSYPLPFLSLGILLLSPYCHPFACLLFIRLDKFVTHKQCMKIHKGLSQLPLLLTAWDCYHRVVGVRGDCQLSARPHYKPGELGSRMASVGKKMPTLYFHSYRNLVKENQDVPG